MSISVVCLGAGGHAGMIAEMLEKHPQYHLAAFLDKKKSCHHQNIHNVVVLGDDTMLPSIKAKHNITHFIVGIGATKSCALRAQVYQQALKAGLKPISLIHPSALIMNSANIGEGVVVMPGAVINRNVSLASNVIINSAAVIEHDSLVGSHSHIATAACVAGGVSIGEQVLVGANSVIREQTTIGDHAIVGAGSVVINNVKKETMVLGCPAMPKEQVYG